LRQNSTAQLQLENQLDCGGAACAPPRESAAHTPPHLASLSTCTKPKILLVQNSSCARTAQAAAPTDSKRQPKLQRARSLQP
jgi:hypothetical protein